MQCAKGRGRMMKHVWLTAAAGVIALSGVTAAQERLSLKVRQRHADELEKLQSEYVGYTSEKCGKEITGGIDWTNFPTDDSLFSHTPSGFCSHAFSAVHGLCEASDLAKEAVQQSINSVSCHYGDISKTEITADGAFNAYFEWDTPNLVYQYRDFLENNL